MHGHLKLTYVGQGDLARFVVFRKVGTEIDWQYAIPSESFLIEDEIIRNSTGEVSH